MTTFVLVHGAWHGGWCWRPVADRLRAAGHDVFAPTLTGLCDRSHLLTRDVGLDTHVTDVANLIDWEELGDVVLCGHSYGGMVIAGAAERATDRIAALVYLDAFVPAPGSALFDHIPEDRQAGFRQRAADAGDGWLAPPPDASIWVEDKAQQAWLNAKVTPHPLRSMEDRLPDTDARAAIANRVYVYATENPVPTFAQFHARYRDDPGWRMHTVPTSHDAMVSMPDAVAAALADAAG